MDWKMQSLSQFFKLWFLITLIQCFPTRLRFLSSMRDVLKNWDLIFQIQNVEPLIFLQTAVLQWAFLSQFWKWKMIFWNEKRSLVKKWWRTTSLLYKRSRKQGILFVAIRTLSWWCLDIMWVCIHFCHIYN